MIQFRSDVLPLYTDFNSPMQKNGYSSFYVVLH